MEVTPEAVREGKFREALRGYHRDDVDEFLEQVASGIAVLHERLRQATERAARAEAQATEAAEIDESLKRTLVLAQRTADLAMEEARREAADLVADAHAQRDALTNEITAERDRLREETQKTVQDEVHTLYETRQRLVGDIDALDQYYQRQREWLRASLAEQLRVLDEGDLDVGAPPAVSAVDPSVVNGRRNGAVDDPPVDQEPEDGDRAEATRAVDVLGDDAEEEEDEGDGDEGDGDEGERHIDIAEPEGDSASAFLSELQRVMDAAAGEDDDVLPPPDERARAFFEADDDTASRFGGLRRRRRRP